MSNRYEDAPAHRVARQLAETFGGVQLPNNGDGEFFEWLAVVRVEPFGGAPGYALLTSTRGYGAQKHKVTVTMRPYDHASHTGHETHNERIEFASICVDSRRELQAIAADVSRRLVNNAAARLALERNAQALQRKREHLNGLDAAKAKILKAAPTYRTPANGATSNTEVRLYAPGALPEIRVYTESVRFEYMSLPLDLACVVLALIHNKAPKG